MLNKCGNMPHNMERWGVNPKIYTTENIINDKKAQSGVKQSVEQRKYHGMAVNCQQQDVKCWHKQLIKSNNKKRRKNCENFSLNDERLLFFIFGNTVAIAAATVTTIKKLSNSSSNNIVAI